MEFYQAKVEYHKEPEFGMEYMQDELCDPGQVTSLCRTLVTSYYKWI